MLIVINYTSVPTQIYPNKLSLPLKVNGEFDAEQLSLRLNVSSEFDAEQPALRVNLNREWYESDKAVALLSFQWEVIESLHFSKWLWFY